MLDRLPNYVKPIIFYSIIAGLLLGIMLLIPVIQLFTLFLFWIIGGLVIYLLQKNNFIGKFTQTEGIITGCITGMVSTIASSLVFIPLSMLIGAFTKTASISFLFTTSFFSSAFSMFVLVMLIIFIGLINIVFNIGSALLVIAFFNWLEQNSEQIKEEQNEFKIEL